MESELTKKEVLDLLDRLQRHSNKSHYSMSKHSSEETIWLWTVEKYNEFAELYLRNYYANAYQGASSSIKEFIDKPLSDMPLYINEVGTFEVVAVWRLSIGK
jgi:hypothetical protein